MTRYVCTDVTHRGGSSGAIDVSAQVRLEREMQPRPLVYLAHTEQVVASVAALDESDVGLRRTQVRRILTGTTDPADAPIVLVAARSLRSPRTGLHELDDLRRDEPVVDRLVGPRTTNGTSTFLEIRDDEDPANENRPSPLATEVEQRVMSTPQGIFDLWELADHLSSASRDERSITEALRRSPEATLRVETEPEPWRVVVTCPIPEGDPPTHHQLVFTGQGRPEADVVHGTRVDGHDLVLEQGAREDLDPAPNLARTERRLAAVLVGGAVVALIVLAIGWASGGLAAAARTTPGWLAFATGLALASLGFGAIVLFAPRRPDENVNDTLAVGRFYDSRLELLQIATVVSGAALSLALLFAVIPPLLAMETPRPAASVRLTSIGGSTIATVGVVATGMGAGDPVSVEIREYASDRVSSDLVGSISATAGSSGRVEVSEHIAVSDTAAFLSILVIPGDDDAAICGPTTTSTPGCTVVALPGSLQDGRRPVIVSGLPAAPTAAPTSTPTPSASATPSVPATPSASATPSVPG